jgi:hypothetical protein
MVTQDAAPGTSSTPSRYYWLRSIAAAFVAVVISLSVSIIGRNEAWPHSQSIAFASFLFLIPPLQSLFHRQRVPSWTRRLGLGVIFGLIGGLVHAFVLDR